MKRAIVLSGGGSKGAYQIGVWRALRKLGIDYDIVTGTSIGALNGAFLTMKDYKRAVMLWYFVNYKYILDEKIDGTYDDKKGRREIIRKYVKGALNGGMSITAMEQTVDRFLDVDKFFRSNVDYGLVTVKFPSMKPTIMKKKDLTKENLADYLIASASCFPAFKIKNIDDSKYIDGGYYDNMPINLAIEMGATEVIAVDLSAVGNVKKVENKDIPITIITPNNDIGNFLVIEKKHARRAITLGYNDALKVFKKLDGKYFSYKKDHLVKNYNKYNDLYKKIINDNINIDTKNAVINKIVSKTIYKKILNKEINIDDFNDIVEETGKILSLNDEHIYSESLYNFKLRKVYNAIKIDNIKIKEIITSKKTKSLIDRSLLLKYIVDEISKGKKYKLGIYNLALLFPKEFLSAIYMITITK